MIDEQSSASGHDYALDRSAIGAGSMLMELAHVADISHKLFCGTISLPLMAYNCSIAV